MSRPIFQVLPSLLAEFVEVTCNCWHWLVFRGYRVINYPIFFPPWDSPSFNTEKSCIPEKNISPEQTKR